MKIGNVKEDCRKRIQEVNEQSLAQCDLKEKESNKKLVLHCIHKIQKHIKACRSVVSNESFDEIVEHLLDSMADDILFCALCCDKKPKSKSLKKSFYANYEVIDTYKVALDQREYTAIEAINRQELVLYLSKLESFLREKEQNLMN